MRKVSQRTAAQLDLPTRSGGVGLTLSNANAAHVGRSVAALAQADGAAGHSVAALAQADGAAASATHS